MLVVVSYDITDDRRRVAVSNELLNFGVRVQKSVFECYLDADQLKELKGRLETKIDLRKDHVRFYHLCKKDEEHVATEGKSVIHKDYDYFMV
jgi:CRISPR-associated protein Cas2